MVDSAMDAPVAEKLCMLCSEQLWNQGLEKRAHHLSIEKLTDSTRCPLCRLFCSAMEGAKTVIEQPDQTFVAAGWSQKFREALKGSAITIDPLPYHPHFSEQVPFRFLQPSAGGPGNRRQGRAVGVICEKTSYLEEIQNRRTIWKQQDSNLDERLKMIRSWLAECRQSHKTCGSDSASKLPKRVIDVELMVLYEPSDREREHYTALSYCWGRDSSGNDILTTKTTPNNLEDRKKSLWLEGETKHKTFRDAIAITRGLGIHYLWIDALCIVQGDGGDFESEAGKMADYYGRAKITLAATDSVDCEGGMLYPSNLRQNFSASWFKHWGRTGYAFLESMQTDFENDINLAPLNQRGWVLQEGIFSQRMVHFCKKQLIWECKSQVASEDGLFVLSKDNIRRPFALSKPLNPARSVYEDWDDIVQGYSGRLLSKAKDKTLALAGATTRFRNLIHDDHRHDAVPLLGLWKEDFHAGLLWRGREPSGRIEAVELKSIPSWSWMGFDGPVTFDTEHRECFRSPRTIEMVMKVDFVGVKWEGKELTSKVNYAKLDVSGIVIPFSSIPTTIEGMWWDSPRTEKYMDKNMFLLLVAQVRYRSGWNPEGNWIFGTKDYFLIIAENFRIGGFSRVGMGAIDNGQGARGYFADQSTHVVHLV